MAQQSMSSNGVLISRATGKKQRNYTRKKLRQQAIARGLIRPELRSADQAPQLPRRYDVV